MGEEHSDRRRANNRAAAGTPRTSVTEAERAALTGRSAQSPDLRPPLPRARPRRHRSRRSTWLLVLAGAAGLLLVALWLLRTHVPESFPPTSREVAAERMPLRAYSLYFPSAAGSGLTREIRLLPQRETQEAGVRSVIEALVRGPACQGLCPWPPETTVLDVFISGSGIAYVNLGGSLRWLLPQGDLMEWGVVASLTRTLCENFPAIRGVRVLVDGESSGALGRVMPLGWTYQPAMFEEMQ